MTTPVQHATEKPPSHPIRIIDQVDQDNWNSYLCQHPDGSVYQRFEWNEVLDAYNLPVIRLAAVRDNQWIGAVALVRQKSLLFGNRLVSMPWFDTAGILADCAQAEKVLLDAALERLNRLGGDQLVLRQSRAVEWYGMPLGHKQLMRLELDSDAETLWKQLNPKVRNQVRKAQKLELRYDSGGVELLNDFFGVYCANMRDLGSPSHSRLFFHRVMQQFSKEARIHVVRLDKMAIGAGLTLANGTILEIPWASSVRRYNSYCVNHLMYWNILSYACEAGFSAFHFGRSTVDSGPYRFKKQWGTDVTPLYWYILDADGSSTGERPEESFGLARQIWTRMPIWITRRLGPTIIQRVA